VRFLKGQYSTEWSTSEEVNADVTRAGYDSFSDGTTDTDPNIRNIRVLF
jgi:hypothetical protein